MDAQPHKAKIKQFLLDKKKAYSLIFKNESPHTKEVLADLEKFCRANESCFHQDPRLHAVLEGRREVFLRIKKYIETPIDELVEEHIFKRKEM